MFTNREETLRMAAPRCSRAPPHNKLMQTRGPLFPDPMKLYSFLPVYPVGALRACFRRGQYIFSSPNLEGGLGGHGPRHKAGPRECGADEGCPPGRPSTAGKAALTPSLPHPAGDRGGRLGLAQFCLPARMTMTAAEAERRGRRRDRARKGPLSREWRLGEGAIYRTKLRRRQLRANAAAAPA